MSSRLFVPETNPLAPSKRAFFDGRPIPYKNLAELRAAMVEDDKRLIDFIGARMIDDYWIDPVVDLSESAHSRVGQLALQARPRHHGFPQMIEAVYGALATPASPLIDRIDQGIIDAIAARTEKAMLATVFKLDRAVGPDPVQQAKNIANAVEISRDPNYSILPTYGDLSAVVHNVYGVLVPTTANKLQQEMFKETYLLPPHYAEPGRDDWDTCLANALGDLVPQGL